MNILLKQRIVSASIGICIFAILMYFLDTLAFNLALTLAVVVAIFEFSSTILERKFKSLTNFNIVISVLTAFFLSFSYIDLLIEMLFISNLIAVIYAMQNRRNIKLEKIFFSHLFSIVISMSLFSLICIKNLFCCNIKLALLSILLVVSSAWATDTGAYFTGRLFGKHKLYFEDISPKKTKEGILGGFLTSLCCGLIICLIFKIKLKSLQVNWCLLVIALLVSAALAVLSDLFASLIKRQNNIKDFGTIMPGHGGALDRLDSLIFVAPFYYFIFSNFKVFSL